MIRATCILMVWLISSGFIGRDMDRYRPAGLLAGYTFNDASGRDASGNGRTLTFVGSASAAGGFLSLNGSSQYAQSPSDYALGTGSFTVLAWVYMDSVSVFSAIIDNRNSSGLDGILCGVRNNGKANLFIEDPADSDSVEVQSTATLTTATWYHLAFVYDRSGNATVYVDGAASGSASLASIGGNLTQGISARWGFRTPPASAWTYFAGDMDGCAIIYRVLTAAEISQIYHAGRTPR